MTDYFGSGWELHELLLRRDLVAQGFSDAGIHALVHEGRLRRLSYGLLAVGPAPEDPRVEHAQRAAGAARLHGERIALSHHSALAHHHLPLSGYVDLGGPVQAIRRTGGTSSSSAVKVWRPRTSPPTLPLEGGGLVVTPVAAALQVAGAAPLVPAVVVLDACLHAGLFTHDDLMAGAEQLPRSPGAHQARVAAAVSRDGAQSPRETELRLFVEDLGFQTETQFPVSTSQDEPPFAWVDLRIKGSRALLEYDGEQKYESGRAAPLIAERNRERRIVSQGWGIERVVAQDMLNRRSLARRIHDLVREWPESA